MNKIMFPQNMEILISIKINYCNVQRLEADLLTDGVALDLSLQKKLYKTSA